MISNNIFILLFLTLLISSLAFRPCLKFAQRHNIVDKPDKRKLQDHPIPVNGGITVVLGMIIPLVGVIYFFQADYLWYAIVAVLVLWTIGIIDDVRGLSAYLRFILELVIIWILLWQPTLQSNGLMINNLGGLFGRYDISPFTAIPLTLIACVGIINAINLIDGVDGYSSGYGIMANLIFAFVFFFFDNPVMGMWALIAAISLIPFYLHNVFGQDSKMYIGDGGSLVIGFVMAYNVLAILDGNSLCNTLANKGIGTVAITSAILCIPVFDTLRVMFARLFRGVSPFMPDKTHLHHLFIDMGFSHIGTSTIILLTQLFIIALWYISYVCGVGINGQFYLVVALGLLVCLFYYALRREQRNNSHFWQQCCHFGQWTHFERKGPWLKIQNLIDKI
ncbi:MAG: undecaprenyl/decaprenyl-phosphate alpha-N-acetylglucosaminyl 1-phosphate transferase [Paludibacteraceae bacterium]|nr:undecaprenyl/decaprenyl-phosphate alpha-N-acetylglucosaminyl 1-phosphate transferase [Paludibacteraceae bacterium]